MRGKTREEKAITLVALIITIIVLLILAVVAINAVTGDGIIQHASNAKIEYEKAQAEEESILSYYTEYLDNEGNMGPWRKENNTLIKNDGNETVKIELGSIVNYNPRIDKNNQAVTKTYTSYAKANASADKNNGRTSGHTSDQTYSIDESSGFKSKWRVIGTQSGNILLMGDINNNDNVGSYSLGNKEAYLYGEEELDAICSMYGYGKGAIKARSIKVEDIDKITGYNPLKTGESKKYKEGETGEYGCRVTYYMKTEGKVSYKADNAKNEVDGTYENVIFVHPDGRQLTVGGESISIANDMYSYYPETLTRYNDTGIKGTVIPGSIMYNLLFENKEYWLANNFSLADSELEFSHFGMRRVSGGRVSGVNNYLSSWGDGNYSGILSADICPVVILSSDIELTKIADGSYNIQ